MDSSSRPNQMIRLRYMNDTGTPNKIMTLREIKKAAVQYVTRYLGEEHMLHTIDTYGAAKRFTEWRIEATTKYKITSAYERKFLQLKEYFNRRSILFLGNYFCMTTVHDTDIYRAPTAKDTAHRFLNWNNGSPTSLRKETIKLGRTKIDVTNYGVLPSMQESIEGMRQAHKLRGSPFPLDRDAYSTEADYTTDLMSFNYFLEWQNLKPEVRQYITARVFGFENDPMFNVLTGDTGDYEEVTVSCKLDVSSEQSLMHTVGIPFVKKSESAGFTGEETTAFIQYTDTIEIPTLKKGNEYYLDYRSHRSDIKGLNYVQLGLVRNRMYNIRTSWLFRGIDDADTERLLSASRKEYKRTVDEPPSTDENIKRLKADAYDSYPPPGSFDFAIDYHNFTTRADRGTLAYTGSVLGYSLPFKVVENDGGAWATFAPMKAHQGFNAKNVPVYKSRIAPTAASIVASLNRPSVQNAVGMALQAIPAGKAGDVILYDSM